MKRLHILLHIELIREAFNQIDRYESDSFRVRYGLFEYVQIYVISNGTNTILTVPDITPLRIQTSIIGGRHK